MKTEYQRQYDDIQRRLRRLHNLRRAIQVARWTGLTLLVVIAVLGACAAGDHFFHWSLATRVVVAAGYYALLVLLGWRWIGRAVRRCGGLERTARLVESRYADMDQSLVGAVQFAGPARTGAGGEAPEVFIEGMVGDAHGKLPEVKSRRLVRASEAAAAALLLLLPLALLLVSCLQFPQFASTYARRLLAPGRDNPLALAGFDIRVAPGDARLMKGEKLTVTVHAPGLGGRPAILRFRPAGARAWREEILAAAPDDVRVKVFPNVTEDFQYRVRIARDETPVYSVEVIRFPEIVGFTLTYRFPAYTGLEQRRLKSASGDITAPAGAEVEVEVAADRPLAEARVEFEGGGEPIVLNPRKASRFQFTLRVREAQRYRVALVDVKGVAGQSPVWYTVKPLPDRPPSVKLVLPGDHVRATPVAEVPVAFTAEDDYGFSKVRLRYAIDDRDEQFVEFDAGGRKFLHLEHLFQIETLNLKPGNQVMFSVEVLDNDALSQESRGSFKRAASDLMFIMIQHVQQEYVMLGGTGGGVPGVKTDIIAAQRAVVSDTWPFIEVPEDSPAARAEMKKVGETQGKVREKAIAAAATMRAKRMSPKAIAAMEKSVPLMEKAAADLEAGRVQKAFRWERAALAALLESYDYSVAELEAGTGGAGEPGKLAEKLEEIKIKSESRLAMDEKKSDDQFMAGLAGEIGRMQEEQENLRRDLEAARPPDRPAETEPAPGGERPSADKLTPGQQARHLEERQENLAERAAELAGQIEQQPAAQPGAAAMREVGELLDQAREAMQGAADALGRTGEADRDIPQLPQAQANAQQAAELLAEAAQKADGLSPERGGDAVEKALKDLEALRADFEKKRAEAQAGQAPAAGEPPAGGEKPAAGSKPGKGTQPGGKPPMGAGEAADRLEEIAAAMEADAEGQGQALAQAMKAAADSLRKSEKSSPGEGGGSAKKPGGEKPPDAKDGKGKGKGAAGGKERGGEGETPEEGVGTGLTSRTLDELVERFLMAPLLKEKAKQKAEHRERPAVPYRDAEDDYFKRVSEEALP